MFELLEHTADVGIKGTGRDLNEAFAETAKGMFSIIAEAKGIRLAEENKLEVKAENLEELLVEFLNELLYLFYTEKILFREFEVEIDAGREIEGGKAGLSWKGKTRKRKEKEFALKCTARGEMLDEKKHGLRSDVKAATYTGLKIGREKGKFFAQCILDV